MRVIYGIGNLAKGGRDPKVITVGVFDGVHRGHRRILRRVVSEAKKRGLCSAIVTFSLHPSRLIDPSSKIPHVTSLEHKLLLLEREGVDLCYCIDFNKAFAALPPESFIKDILLKKIRMVSLYVGEDFVFGRGARGDKDLLRKFSRDFHFRLHIIEHLKVKGRIVSSTLIRRLIREGDLAQARTFLGEPVSLLGKVIAGEGRGKTLGFPTANIKPPREVLLPDGIYATQALCQGRRHKSVTYIGTKPTFRRRKKVRSIEVFLLDFAKNIYGQRIEIRFIGKIRDDKKFPSKEALVKAMEKDVVRAREILMRPQQKTA